MLNESMIEYGNMVENRLSSVKFDNGVKFVWEPSTGGWFIFVNPHQVSKTYISKHECLHRYNQRNVDWL